MRSIEGIGLSQVQAVYAGAEGDLWELIMGEQIHIGGFASSMALADKAGIEADSQGIDLCCCSGAGMRFLLNFRGVARMIGVDATAKVVERGRERNIREGFGDELMLVTGDATETGLHDSQADFIWGEDAWCYVVDKERLIAEAVRLVKPGGTLAFTDWIEGPAGLSPEEAQRFLSFMKFPNLQDIDGYKALLEAHGCEVRVAEDTEAFAPHIDLYLKMLSMQLTYDALKIIDYDVDLMGAMSEEMVYMQELARAGKLAQGRFVATKG